MELIVHRKADRTFAVVDKETGEIFSEHETRDLAKASIFAIEVWGTDNGVELTEFGRLYAIN